VSKGRLLVLALASLAWMAAGGLLATRAFAPAALASVPTVLSLKLTGVVDPFMASYVERGIDVANRDGDAAVLLTIDTPGGLDSSMRHIVQAILASKVPVLCYTAPSGARAASAGTFVMLACPVDAMAPGTNIGAAHPVGVSGAIESEKVTNDAAAFIRSLATRWNRNADWAEMAVRNAISASDDQALSLHVVDIVAPGTTSLFQQAGGCSAGATAPSTGLIGQSGAVPGLCNASVKPFGMSLSESLFHSLADPNVAFLLINIGFVALIVWVFHPGFHVSLAVGIISMVIGLAILETLPVRLVGFVLLLVSAILFVLDVKAKAHGVLTAGGIATLILGGLLLFNPSVPSAYVSRPLIVGVAVAAGLFTMFSLRALLSAKGQPVRTGREVLEGSVGVVLAAIAPRGTVRARGETWTAESSTGEPIPAGAPVRIVRVQGVKLLVRPQPDSELTPAATASGAPKEGNQK
jgi:membrane-bound serine protease (ClpP class)